jgi:hypothetical protein
MKSIFRYEVTISDDATELIMSGDPLHVALTEAQNKVEFWAEARHDNPERLRRHQARSRIFQIFGTGAMIPDRAKYWGTAPRSWAGEVWHLYELNPRGAMRSGTGSQVVINTNSGGQPDPSDAAYRYQATRRKA